MDNEIVSTNGVTGTISVAGCAALGRRPPEVPQSVIQQNPLKNVVLNIATWNVRTMNPHGSMEQIVREAERLKINVLGIAETHWMGNGVETTPDGWEMSYSGGNTRYAGVGILIRRELKEAVTEIRPISDRVITMRMDAKPRPLNLVQAYFPTSASEEDEVKEVYASIQRVVDSIPGRERLIVMGDFNAKIGANHAHPACGKFGLGDTNERGEMLLDWMEANKLIAVNTCFQHRKKQRAHGPPQMGKPRTL
jgi:hypothetical protein